MSLTNEGGRLKRDVMMVDGKDFKLVPEAVWKALSAWYGGSPALPRTVSFYTLTKRMFVSILVSICVQNTSFCQNTGGWGGGGGGMCLLLFVICTYFQLSQS